MGATRISSIAGRPGEEEEGSELEVGWVEETRDFASAITASARWRDCERMEELDSRFEFKVVREEISACRVEIAA